MTETKPKRRWFRFLDSRLAVGDGIAALAVGWWLDHLTNRKATQNVVYNLKYAAAESVCEMLQRRFFADDVHVIVGPTADAVFVRAPNLQADIKARISLIDAANMTK